MFFKICADRKTSVPLADELTRVQRKQIACKTMIKVLTYNIHKGFDRYNRDFVLHKIKDHLKNAEVDVVLLQEIQGRHLYHENQISSWPDVSQFEYLADSIWPHFAYGKNA